MTDSTRLPSPLTYGPRHGNPLVTAHGPRAVERLMQEGRR